MTNNSEREDVTRVAIEMSLSFVAAITKAGGTPSAALSMLKRIPNEVLHSLSANGIRFTYVPPEDRVNQETTYE